MGVGCREGEKDDSLDIKQVPGLLVHAARVSGFVNIATVGPMHVEEVIAAVNKKGAVIKERPAVAAVQMGCS